jgi:hypothetical protein
MSVQYDLTSWRWGHTQTRIGGGGAAATHISIESSELEDERCGAVAAGSSHLLHTQGRRSDAAAAGASQLLA